ncbi:MAG: hypothetical protein A2900_03575 [Candidatus Chisholmbacteria bacterium RIFCSPLOWO2_01_FULL_50_28]|uniref:Glycosyltransferase 2-like domain-containing protein n=1 Tax=Candidatus Chisholmbacteria bacterium RIFCSPHIGHO2_01_FULL_52_32 TaxID=1797591 RepID=A0A1G1VSU0_9BACT|nr:MAG: hypothetical protein A2786_03170 [Candidatus Chisholmbacteria bacterium RIFCSPHIGHO2_01_FULL_52_32]OGY20156.1 MAG: hypothetical protein A2900_03575 [Candidatus Chisholmbacteria bacterium RIFCSPLOWO2_01_FULL_50_28]
MNNPFVSVVIPAYNEEKVIGECLSSLNNQTYKPLEIIVVDDGSTDRTEKILKTQKGIRLVKQDHRGPGAARNKGAMKARGEILVFVDADMTFDRRFIDRLSAPIRDGKTVGTFSKEEIVSNLNNRFARYWSLNRGFAEGRMHPKNYPDTQPVFRAIRKEKFLEAGGFNPKAGYTDDWTLSQKLGIPATHAEGAVFYHSNPETLREVFSQARWMAKRPYKLGIVGSLLALVRASLPLSLVVGLVKAIRYKSPSFLPFKVVVDFATNLGIISMLFGRSRAK